MTPLRVATYNVHRCVGMDGRHEPQRTLDVIASLGADVLGLQEVDSRTGLHADGFTTLREGTGLHAVEGPNLREGRGAYGNLLLSRWPAAAVRRLDLSVAGREPRGAIDVDIHAPQGRLRVVVTHLGLGLRERSRQLRELRRLLAERQSPVTVLMGDLNVAHWRGPDLFGTRVARPGAMPKTFPSRLPLLALDRIQACPADALGHIESHRSQLARITSDHLPLVADIDDDAWNRDAPASSQPRSLPGGGGGDVKMWRRTWRDTRCGTDPGYSW